MSEPEPEEKARRVNVRHSVQERTNETLGASVPMDGTNFFELGGDSLSAAKIASDIGNDLGVEVPVDLVFDSEDLRDLAERLEHRLGADSDACSGI